MQIQERLIVPGLGVVILLSAFILGVPLVYKLLLGLLGLAATGTYFVPHAVQVETRIAIAALGLIILLIISSTAFWLTLLSFGAIAALQIPHRHTLQRSSATIAWLNAVLERRSVAPTGEVADGGAGEEAGASAGQEAETVAPTGDGESRPQAPSVIGTLPGFVRMDVAGIGGLVVGVLVLIGVFLPWFDFRISAFGEMAGSLNFTLGVAAEELELPLLRGFFFILIVLGLLSIVSITLPRVVAAIIAGLGLAGTLASYLYVVAEVEREAAELSSIGVGATTLPAIGSLIAGLCFLVMLVLQLIPGLNRPRGKG